MMLNKIEYAMMTVRKNATNDWNLRTIKNWRTLDAYSVASLESVFPDAFES